MNESSAEYRLLVTGSREYDDRMSLRASMSRVLESLPAYVTLVVVHGGEENPEESFAMSDRIAGEWALEMQSHGLPVRQEAHPAKWEDPCRPECSHGPRGRFRGRSMCQAAGPYRNDEMCRSRIDSGLAAVRVGTKSVGTKDCMLRMIRYGIPFQMVVQGKAAGLPQDLIEAGRQGQGRPA